MFFRIAFVLSIISFVLSLSCNKPMNKPVLTTGVQVERGCMLPDGSPCVLRLLAEDEKKRIYEVEAEKIRASKGAALTSPLCFGDSTTVVCSKD